jgi:predicted phage terminase large subunit-like protein
MTWKDEPIALRAAKAELCKRSFHYFFLEFWETVSAETLVENWHQKYLCDELQIAAERVARREKKEYDIVINIPPGESKSTIATILWPVWCWLLDPTLKEITASFDATLAMSHVMLSMDCIQSDKFRAYFPGTFEIRRDKDSKSMYGNDKKGERRSVGTKGNITGTHAHIIIVDDPLNPKAAQSKDERTAVNRWMSETLPTRKVDKEVTLTVLIMQRLHTDDTTAEFMKRNTEVKHICLPAELSPNVSPAELREFYNEDGLMNAARLKKSVLQQYKGLVNYHGQFGQSPIKQGGTILNSEWIFEYNLSELMKDAKANGVVLVWNYVLDGSFTNTTGTDPSCCFCYTVYKNKIYIRDRLHGWFSFTQLMAILPKFLKATGYTNNSLVRIEPKANGFALIDTLVNSHGINAVKSYSPTKDKETMAHSITPGLQAGRVGVPAAAPWKENLYEELEAFPKGDHDDQVDCIVMMYRNEFEKGGLLAMG